MNTNAKLYISCLFLIISCLMPAKEVWANEDIIILLAEFDYPYCVDYLVRGPIADEDMLISEDFAVEILNERNEYVEAEPVDTTCVACSDDSHFECKVRMRLADVNIDNALFLRIDYLDFERLISQCHPISPAALDDFSSEICTLESMLDIKMMDNGYTGQCDPPDPFEEYLGNDDDGDGIPNRDDRCWDKPEIYDLETGLPVDGVKDGCPNGVFDENGNIIGISGKAYDPNDASGNSCALIPSEKHHSYLWLLFGVLIWIGLITFRINYRSLTYKQDEDASTE